MATPAESQSLDIHDQIADFITRLSDRPDQYFKLIKLKTAANELYTAIALLYTIQLSNNQAARLVAQMLFHQLCNFDEYEGWNEDNFTYSAQRQAFNQSIIDNLVSLADALPAERPA